MLCLGLASCSGIQSALDPAGEEAAQVATLFWTMVIGGFVIWAGVIALALYASRWKKNALSEAAAGRLILWAGVAFPVVVLAALLSFALWLMPSLRPFVAADSAAVRIGVVGNQFWWRVAYERADGSTVISANEIRLPVGQRVEFALDSADMIHSFWIPALGGKMDMIPGRTNRLSLQATRTGTFRGQCAEFCGTAHALMAFPVIVMEPAAFDAWLAERAAPSSGASQSSSGKDIFFREKCGRCHEVSGTEARGVAGPSLSHVGSRVTLGAGLMANDRDAMVRFIRQATLVKPASQMPAYTHLSDSELGAVADWLGGLK